MSKLDSVIERIEKARLSFDRHQIVKIVGVSKYTDSNSVRELYKDGQRAFGENQVQSLEAKIRDLKQYPLEWHFIGNLQKNKINKLLKLNPFMIQSISSIELAIEIDKRANKKIKTLLQINSANEETKSGVKPEMAKDIFQEIRQRCPNLDLQGVMSIGANTNEEKEIIKSFEITKKIYDSLDNVSVCSMGMSNDYELAIKNGSNLVRLGSVLFKN